MALSKSTALMLALTLVGACGSPKVQDKTGKEVKPAEAGMPGAYRGWVDPKGAKADYKRDVKVDYKRDVKVDSRRDVKVDYKRDVKVDHKVDHKVEHKVQPNADFKIETPKPQLKSAGDATQKTSHSRPL